MGPPRWLVRLLTPELSLLPDPSSRREAIDRVRRDLAVSFVPSALAISVLAGVLISAAWWMFLRDRLPISFFSLALLSVNVGFPLSALMCRGRIRRAVRRQLRYLGVRVCLECGHQVPESKRCSECGKPVPPLPLGTLRDAPAANGPATPL